VPEIIARSGDTQHDLETTRLSRVDGCPTCLDYNTPLDVRPARDGFAALYWCPCGEAWVTSWTDD
jgi:hypothetical protein